MNVINAIFHENSFGGEHIVARGRTDGRTGKTKSPVDNRSAKTPNNLN